MSEETSATANNAGGCNVRGGILEAESDPKYNRGRNRSTNFGNSLAKDIPLGEDEDPFMVFDIGDTVRKYKNWRRAMPRVEPFYAMKCNSDPMVLNLLAALGVGFGCASKTEIDTVMKLGVEPSRIIYSNPCKSLSWIEHAALMGIKLMAFDCKTELYKIKKESPDANLILRIKVQDSSSVAQIERKFGCEIEEIPPLLQIAKNLSLNVIGVCFHVGIDAWNPSVFSEAISSSKQAFNIAKQHGYNFRILNIGGGYPGKKELSPLFEQIASEVNQELDQYFPPESGVRIIAEPGRYFVASAFTLYANVIGRREAESFEGNEMIKKYEYYVNEGVYGPFHFMLFHEREFTPIPVKDFSSMPLYLSLVWGPTCDSADKISEDIMLPKLEIGDWVLFNDMGDYSISATSTFNGFPKATIKYADPDNAISSLQLEERWSKQIMNVLRNSEIKNFALYHGRH